MKAIHPNEANDNVQVIDAVPVENVLIGRPTAYIDPNNVASSPQVAGVQYHDCPQNGQVAGVIIKENYCGPITCLFALFICPFVCCCPCDQRMVFIDQNGTRTLL